MSELPRHKREQAMAALRDGYPRMWFNLYQGSLEAGFNELQSFILLQTFILAQNPYGIRPNPTDGPESEFGDSTDPDDS